MSLEITQFLALEPNLRGASARAIRLGVVLTAKTAYDIERDGKSASPVDTGNLRSSISSSVHGLSAEIGPTAKYGAFVEEGTSRHAPQPFMRPAADKHLPTYEAAWAEILGAAL